MKWLFRKRRSRALEILEGAKWKCSNCDQPHEGMFDLASKAPDPWPYAREFEPNSAVRLSGDFLSEDFCVLGGEHFFVRSVLEIPIHGLRDKFAYGCWGSLKKENFETYLEVFDGGSVPASSPWWSWLCNSARPYANDESVGCWMFPQLHRQRPVLKVDNGDHPLAIAQEDGISPEELLEIYQTYGHGPAS